ncbi:MFS transporter [Kitasatospora sp. NBC_01287]|uniref:MFS transporter n=1 Tax=Kitasatospora sp. NBC_01287 TaxID=2903573 RepID=UPI00224EF328|nr:MFS transporter [Kitasatospora sp. NBC_01287]MCX4744836.1 MFS transporter [Kitasatospora sp. NBC_01287]
MTTEPVADVQPQPPAPPPLRRNRDFNLLWSGQAVSALGTQMSGICYPLLVLSATGSAAQAGLVGGATLVGSLVMLLPAGVVADHYPRKRLLLITSVLQLLAVGSVVPAVLTHHLWLAHLMVVGALQGCASAFFMGAGRGAVRRIVPSAQLPQAMSLTQARGQAAAMIGPPLGGALFGVAQSLPFLLDALSFGAITLTSALVRGSLDPEPTAAERPREPIRSRITAGARYVLREPTLRLYASWAAAVNAVAAGMLLMVIVLARSRGANAPEVGALVSASAICGLAGSLLGPRLVKLFGGRLWVLVTSWLLPTCAVGIALSPWVWLMAVLGALTTFTVMPAVIVFQVQATRITPDNLQAQTGNAIQLFGSSLSWLAPSAFGLLADSAGARTGVLVAAALYGATALWLQGNRALRGFDAASGTAQ